MSDGKRFAYEHFVEGLDSFVEGQDNPGLLRALRMVKFMVLASAWCDFRIWDAGVNEKDAMAWAWEDMVMAFKGFGENSLTGVVISFWSAGGRDVWEEGRRALNRASCKADDETSNLVPRRYLLKYRIQTIRTPELGFDLPSIVPAKGERLRQWATREGLDPDEVETQMAVIEEYERMGLIDLSEDSEDSEEGRPTLSLVKGGDK
ncbi:hypothetical protein CMI37_16540 [Candidatus Pacearchaeota archaeon]|nr:hypothetical protein [Candidatus Pacearchaeota archaeon]